MAAWQRAAVRPWSRRAALGLLAGSTLPATRSHAGGAATPDPRATPFEVGVVPHLSARRLLEIYAPMREFLAASLARPVHLSTAAGWPAFQRRVADDAYDLVVTAAHFARLAQVDHGWTPVAMFQPGIQGLLITAAARPLGSVRDLAGGTLALANPLSLVAVRGLQWLAERGLERGVDFAVVAAATDDGVGGLLVRGDARAAMISGGEHRAIDESVRARLNVMTVFAEVPGFVMVASPRLEAVGRQRVAEALLRFGSSSAPGRASLRAVGVEAIVEVPPGLLASMDVHLPSLRQMLAASS